MTKTQAAEQLRRLARDLEEHVEKSEDVEGVARYTIAQMRAMAADLLDESPVRVRAIRDVQELPTELKYFSTVRGEDEQLEDGDYLYHGLVFRIPGDLDEEDIHRLTPKHFQRVKELAEELTDDRIEVAPTLERYEVYDGTSEDILVMFRIPTRPRKH